MPGEVHGSNPKMEFKKEPPALLRSHVFFAANRQLAIVIEQRNADVTISSGLFLKKEKFNREVARMAGPVSTSGGGAGVWGELVVGRSVGG